MKNSLIIAFIALGSITILCTPVMAAGSSTYRIVKSNNLLECSTNQQIEQIWTGGNSSSFGANHLLICLNGNRKAKWIMYSQVSCQSPNVKLRECPIWFNNEHKQNEPNQFPIKGDFTKLGDRDNTYLFNPKKTGIGTNCNIARKSAKYLSVYYEWSCEKYTSHENLTINTKGYEPHLGTGELYQKYGEIPSQFQLNTFDHPDCSQNKSSCSQDYPSLGGDREKLDPKIYIDCRGDTKFCDWYYNPQPFE